MANDYLGPILAQAARTVAEFQRVNARQIAQLLKSQESALRVANDLVVRDVMQKAALDAARINREIGAALQRLQKEIVDSNVINRIYEAWDASQQRAAAILAEKGWWVTPDLPLGLLTNIVELHESKKSRRINKAMCDYYTGRRIKKLVDGWDDQPLFARRKHIFMQALWAHNKGRWYLAIPVLLTQIDGILQDYAGQTNLRKGTSVKRIAAELNLPAGSPRQIISDTWYAQLTEIFGSGFHQTETRQRGLRRSAILHGLELRYATRVRATQLFLQLQTIHWLISQHNAKAAA